GTNSLWLARQGFRTTGVDLATGAVAAAEQRRRRAKLRAAFRVANALRLPFARASFDAALDVGCFHTIPIARRPDYATEVARVVRRGGTFLLAWIAREQPGAFGPPHRLSLLEVAQTFEKEFILERTQFTGPRSRGWPTSGGRLAQYTARLIRRVSPQPSVR
ncbi:MAG: class I SAM-dependent methyltransferase, partial [Thermoplasmata archaeon]|nr:class I SAM-dependent methyltransferase [Thermoplasmata archaeon]